MRFMVTSHWSESKPKSFPSARLRRDNWDDFTFKTTFDVDVFLSPTKMVNLGLCKILRRGQSSGETELPDRQFTALGDEYISLGQSVEYYEKLLELPEAVRHQLTEALRDAAADSARRDDFVDELGWVKSLLRFGDAESALSIGQKLFRGAGPTRGLLGFTLHWDRPSPPIAIDFKFDGTGNLPGRSIALIGYNGCGKTTLLSDLAFAAVGGTGKERRQGGARLEGDTHFGSVVTVSYSAFDTFETPAQIHGGDLLGALRSKQSEGDTSVFGYVYCGLRRIGDASQGSLKSVDEIATEFAGALDRCGRSSRRREPLIRAFEILMEEPSFGRAGVNLRGLGSGLSTREVLEAFMTLSTGHKIILNIVTQLAAHLQSRSLVLIDEPETHLHPPLASILLQAIDHVLESYDSFAVIATHSPVVIQESPSNHVFTMQRFGESTEIAPIQIETFGESVSTLTRHAFRLDGGKTGWQGIIRELASKHDVDAVEAMLPRGLSQQARAAFLTLKVGQ